MRQATYGDLQDLFSYYGWTLFSELLDCGQQHGYFMERGLLYTCLGQRVSVDDLHRLHQPIH